MFESLLVIDKQPGPTSFDVVRSVRHVLGGVKTGHTGSLDPFASGVLVLLTGRATRLSGLLLNANKRYRAKVRLGEWTETLDPTTPSVRTAEVPELTLESIQATLEPFQGEWMQVPPAYSAKKVHGVRLYELARQNIHVRRTPSPVQIFELKILSYEKPDIELELYCSKGTYVRSVAEEIGVRLGTVAHLKELRRLACGEFGLEEALTIEQLAEDPSGAVKRGEGGYRRLLLQEAHLRRAGTTSRTGTSPYLPMRKGNDNSLMF